MYRINRKTWFLIYAVAFAVMIYLSLTFGTGWMWGTWAAGFGLFVVLTEPSPRMYDQDPRKGRYDVVCDCPSCNRDGADQVAPEGERDGW